MIGIGDSHDVNGGRVVLIVTCLVVAGLGVTFVLLGWDQANRVATVASALGAVAAVGIAVWAALPGRATSIRASRTGTATARDGGVAVSGVQGPATPAGPLHADRTGDATGTADGQATSGIRLDRAE
jgi:hypothetical protein